MPPGKEDSPAKRGDVNPPSAPHYWELEADLDAAHEELWSLFCHEQGAAGAEVLEDGDSRTMIRYFFNTPPAGCGELEISSPTEGQHPFSAALLGAFSSQYPAGTPPHGIRWRTRPVEAWETAWRVHFRPLAIGKRLLVTPPWEAPRASRHEETSQGEERLRVVIDPGRGFGTGWHASTRLGLMQLEAWWENTPLEFSPRRMLDVGTGSGILAIAAALLTAERGTAVRVTALDIDGDGLPEVRRNFRLSGLAGPGLLVQGEPHCLKGSYSLVTANITAPVLLKLRESLLRLTAPGGTLIVSGVLESERESFLPSFLNPDGNFSARLDAEMHHEGWWGCQIKRESSKP